MCYINMFPDVISSSGLLAFPRRTEPNAQEEVLQSPQVPNCILVFQSLPVLSRRRRSLEPAFPGAGGAGAGMDGVGVEATEQEETEE